MRKMTSLVTVLTLALASRAQEFSDSNLQSLVNAERSFAGMAKEKNTRDAFLAFLAEDAITSAPGQGPRTGKQHLQNQQANESWLWWEPEYSDIASSGDFGFNTGPWEFRQNKTDGKAVAYGHFVSIWKKNGEGEWKVAVDIGIGYPGPGEKKSIKTSAIKLSRPKQKQAVDTNTLFEEEKKFIEALTLKGNSAFEGIRSSEARFYRAGHTPYTTSQEVEQLLKQPAPDVTYTFMDGGVSSSNDLAYVYGKVSIRQKKEDGSVQTRTGSYMRFWKKEDGKHWKIVLDLLTN